MHCFITLTDHIVESVLRMSLVLWMRSFLLLSIDFRRSGFFNVNLISLSLLFLMFHVPSLPVINNFCTFLGVQLYMVFVFLCSRDVRLYLLFRFLLFQCDPVSKWVWYLDFRWVLCCVDGLCMFCIFESKL